MLFERGPRAFFDGMIQLIRGSVTEGYSVQHLCHSASTHIAERIAILSSLQCCLATFLAQVCLTLLTLFLIELSK